MLEKMGEFFDARLNGYEEHQLTCIDSAREFYSFTATCLPQIHGTRLLDIKTPRLIQFNYSSAVFVA